MCGRMQQESRSSKMELGRLSNHEHRGQLATMVGTGPGTRLLMTQYPPHSSWSTLQSPVTGKSQDVEHILF